MNHSLEMQKMGFTIFKDILNENTVTSIRNILNDIEKNEGLKNMLPREVLQLESVSNIYFSDKVISSISSILGENYYIYPNFTVRKNVYVPWHLDVAFKEDIGGLGESPNFIQCAIYLQDNTDSGGGIDIVPGSHIRLEHNGQYYTPESNMDIFNKSVKVKSSAGDLVIFDGRSLHASSPNLNQNNSKTKYAIFFTCSRRDSNYQDMLEHLKGRKYIRNSDGSLDIDSRFDDMQKLIFPNDFPKLARNQYDSKKITPLTLK